MKEALPKLFKFIGALAVTVAIYFALSPDDSVNDKVLNQAMEFLGTKLLAMVPEDQKHQVEKEFGKFQEQARGGKISDEQFKDVAVAIINAEAEGRQFNQEQIDSLLAVLDEKRSNLEEKKVESEESEIQRREDLIAFSSHVQDFEKFEKEWNKKIPLPPVVDSAVPPPTAHFPRRPLYRVNTDFVVEVDSLAVAALAEEHAQAFVGSEAPRAVVVRRIEVDRALRDLSRELPRLKIEMRRLQMHLQMPDSLREELGDDPPFATVWAAEWNAAMADSLNRSMKELQKLQRHQTRLYRHIADSVRKAAQAYEWKYRQAVPPPPPATPKVEKIRPPE
ncbi:MAG: hypothetical protein ALAOOOJD_00698 [bacterium]|nr:hypothetical protein [bacterium]